MRFIDLIVERTEARSRLQWIIFFRFLIIFGCLIAIEVRKGGPSYEPTWAWGFWILIVACVVNVVQALLVRFVQNPAAFGFWQHFLDVLLISGLIYLTGGVLSYFNVLYFAVILGAGGSVSGRCSLFFASLSTILLSIVSIIYFLGAYYNYSLPLVTAKQMQEVVADYRFVISYLLAQGIAFHAVAFLSLVLELRARRSELFREALMRDISEGVIALDAKGRFLYFNDEARKLLGFPPLVPIVGKHWDQVFRRASDKPLRDLVFCGKNTRRFIEMERGGNKILLEVKISHLMDETKQRVMAILGDLTVHQRAADAERRADQLEKVAEMAASMAHELRNPLTSIRACVQELARLQPVDPDAQKLFQIVCRESDRLDHIISEFLGFARMRAPRLEMGDATPIVKEVALLLEKRIANSGITMQVEVEPTLPCYLDREQLQQALMNLGINAIEAMEKGGKLQILARVIGRNRPSIDNRLLGRAGDGAVEISFTDTGPGIAAEHIDEIFTPFYTTKKTGTGLGLAIASRIVRGHGGRIHVRSLPGQGATFTVWLPPPNEFALSRSQKGEGDFQRQTL